METDKQVQGWKRHRGLFCRGSITVEASLAVPLFFLVVCSLLYLFELMGEQMQIQQELVSAARIYETYEIKQPVLSLDSGVVWKLQWDLKEDSGLCKCEWNRSIPVMGNWFSVSVTQKMPVRNYTGASMVPESGADGDRYVYVAENGIVYHMKINCTYLHLGIQETNVNQLQTARNRSGGIYKPCESCMKKEQAVQGMQLFITPYGDRYHKTKDCSGLRRTVRKVKKSQVGALPPCSKCGMGE